MSSRSEANGPVRRTSDTESVSKLEADIEVAGKQVPVALTVFKDTRIQVMSHDVSREDAEKLQNMLADVLDLRIVDRSDPESEAKVRHAHEHARTEASTIPPQKQRLLWPFGRPR